MKIRRATVQDVPEIMALFHDLSARYRDNPRTLELAIGHASTEVYVLEYNGRLAGTATVSFRAVPSYGLVAYVDDVVISSTTQGLGYGRTICEYCIQIARDRGSARIELTSSPQRALANKLYQKLGFVRRDTNSYAMKLHNEAVDP